MCNFACKTVMTKFTLFLILLCGNVFCLYENTSVVHLTPSNFDDLVSKSSDTWLVQFFSSSCPYCEDFAPKFEQAASVLKDTVKIGVIDSDDDKTLLRRFNVKAVPAVKIYRPNNPQPEDYTGPRTVDEIVKKVSSYYNKAIKRKLKQRSKEFTLPSSDSDYEEKNE